MATGWSSRMTHAKLLAAELLSVTVYPSSPPSFSIPRRSPSSISRAEILGVVVSLESKPKFVKFLLDDGTGCVPCILWLHPLLPPSDNDPTPELLRLQARTVRLGEQLRVRGRITLYRAQLQITVADVFVEKDPNMETFHRLDCLRLAKRSYHLHKDAFPST
ncbi:CST complex subunit STN1 [Rhynchospora pubera]|uniref:CST complex subunit STN1 n=1 Tax=Rhynchospora pubera TaxID=906938 RepID=A0AAV8HV52_9POAL|nr:CST complex subunit STN1 [Rhynchospora pubera]